MKLLLDTRALVWWMTDDARLSPRARGLVTDPENRVYLSAASAWEIATKQRLGRLLAGLSIFRSLETWLSEAQIEPLPIRFDHAVVAGSYEMKHRDPFDRIIAAQSDLEQMPVVTIDRAFREFPVETLW